MSDLALTTGDLTKIGIGVIVALVVIGFLISMLITAVIARLVIAAVVVVAAVVVWQQRSSILDKVNTERCGLHATFFGVHVDPPANVRRACRRVTGG